jgi:hypothetical protein
LLVLGGAGLLLGLLLTGLADQDPLPPRALFAFYRGWRGTALAPLKRWYRHTRGRPRTKQRRVLTMRPTKLSKMAYRCDDEVFHRWGLVWRPIWTRVEFLLTDVERSLHVDAETDVAFLVNSSLAAAVVGAVVFVDQFFPWGSSWMNWQTIDAWGWGYLLPAVGSGLLAYVFYVFSHRAADGVAVLRIASIDVHRHDLYERMGIEKPTTLEEEKVAAKELNELLHRERLPEVTELVSDGETRGRVRVIVKGSSFGRDYRAYVETGDGRAVSAKADYVSAKELRVSFDARHVRERSVRIAIFRPDPGGGSGFHDFGPARALKRSKKSGRSTPA